MNNQEELKRKPKKKSNNPLWKTATVGAVAGILGGGVAYAGANFIGQNTGSSASNQVSTVTPTKTSTSSNSDSGTMSAAFNDVKGAVVSVINLQKQEASSSIEDFFGGSYGNSRNGSSSGSNSSSDSSSSSGDLEEYSEGSGVIYLKSNGKGYIVTNNHVIDGSDSIEVILSSGKTVSAKLVGADSETDLAVLSIDAKYVSQVAQFGDSSKLAAADPVIAVGSPLGSEYATSVTQGIISATNRTISITDDNGSAVSQQTVIQTDAAINPGNSGGPLVDKNGLVIGINSMKLSSSTDGTSVEGMGFAIPSNEVVNIANKLVKDGKITRPQLGVRVANVGELTDSMKEQLDISTSVTKGVYIASVTSGGAAANAGIKKGDIITSLDGKDVDDLVSLHTVLYSHNVGDKVTAKVLRNGKTVSMSVTLK